MKQTLMLVLLGLIANATADTLVTTDGTLYQNVTIINESKEGATIQDEFGNKTFLPLAVLPPSIKKDCLHHAHHSMDSIGGL